VEVADVLEHDLPEDEQSLTVDPHGDPLHHHVLALDGVGVVDFRHAGSGDNVHPRVFDDFRAVFPDGILGVDAQKDAVGLTEEDDLPGFIGDENTVPYMIQDGLVEGDFLLQVLALLPAHRCLASAIQQEVYSGIDC